MKTITFTNSKGGVGKTTISTNVAHYLSEIGFKVLFIDSDPQGNGGEAFGLDVDELDYHLGTVLMDGDIKRGIIKYSENLDIIPSNVDTGKSNQEFISAPLVLRSILSDYKEKYDICIIDVNPYLMPTTIMSLTSSDYVVIPLKSGYSGIKGARILKGELDKNKRYYNIDTKILGVVMNESSDRTKLYNETVESLEEIYGKESLFKTRIRNNIKLGEAQSVGIPITEYSLKSNGAKDTISLSVEILERMGVKCVKS